MCAISREAMVARLAYERSIAYERFIRDRVEAHTSRGLDPQEARNAAHADWPILRRPQDANNADLTREPEEKPATTGE